MDTHTHTHSLAGIDSDVFSLSHLVTIAVLPDSGSPKNMNFTIFPRPLVVGLLSANFCAREFILFFRDDERVGE